MKSKSWTWLRQKPEHPSTDVEAEVAQPELVEDTGQSHLEHQVRQLQAELATKEIELFHLRSIQQSSLDRYHSMFYELPIPCFTLNELGHIMEWNHAAAAYFELPEYEVVDKPVSEILGTGVFRSEAEGAVYQVFLGHHPRPVNVNIDLPNGNTRQVRWFVSPVRNGRGDVVGAVNTIGLMPTGAVIETEERSSAAA
ncbi:PAS domain-containing protein [Kamptonema cortianum]|nr:PAS domain-containing protein [Geitlerinema splendidum]MDK3156889.1 PAS domain-containing protein [Kamptonema cortianum]